MSKIRIPRRKKKWHYRDKMFVLTFPYVSKYYRYACYFNIECGIKEFNMTAEELQIKITKLNNILISQNQTWEYNKDKDCYILETDLRGKENYDKWSKNKVME